MNSAARSDGGFDLHTHSVFSDGTTTPAEIAAEAAALGLEGFSLTDHDTVDGWDDARRAARAHHIDFLPGIEITTRHEGHSRHLLGYGITEAGGDLFEELAYVRSSRLARAEKMVDRLARDYEITWQGVIGDGDARTVGRPHIADSLVKSGYFRDRSEVFATVLSPRSPYYIDTHAIETIRAIRMVVAAGGVAVLAHPAAARQRGNTRADELRDFQRAGLWGLELRHPENREEWIPALAREAHHLGLRTTGASDYHGAGKPNVLGQHTTPRELIEELRSGVATPK